MDLKDRTETFQHGENRFDVNSVSGFSRNDVPRTLSCHSTRLDLHVESSARCRRIRRELRRSEEFQLHESIVGARRETGQRKIDTRRVRCEQSVNFRLNRNEKDGKEEHAE